MFIESFIEWANQCLLDEDNAKSYLSNRGVSLDQIRKFSVGFVQSEFEANYAEDRMHSSICSDRSKDHLWCDSCRFNHWSSLWKDDEGTKTKITGGRIIGCIVFPLSSYSGKFIGVQVRSIKEKRFDTFVLSRRPEGYFFGTNVCIESIWSKKEVWLVESAIDQMILNRLIAPNVLAITTNSIGKSQNRFLRRFVSSINMCLDIDKAGIGGKKLFIEKNWSEFNINNINYKVSDKIKDPGDLWKEWGDEKFKKYFASL